MKGRDNYARRNAEEQRRWKHYSQSLIVCRRQESQHRCDRYMRDLHGRVPHAEPNPSGWRLVVAFTFVAVAGVLLKAALSYGGVAGMLAAAFFVLPVTIELIRYVVDV